MLLIGRYSAKQKSVEHKGSWLAMHPGLWVFQRLTRREVKEALAAKCGKVPAIDTGQPARQGLGASTTVSTTVTCLALHAYPCVHTVQYHFRVITPSTT